MPLKPGAFAGNFVFDWVWALEVARNAERHRDFKSVLLFVPWIFDFFDPPVCLYLLKGASPSAVVPTGFAFMAVFIAVPSAPDGRPLPVPQIDTV